MTHRRFFTLVMALALVFGQACSDESAPSGGTLNPDPNPGVDAGDDDGGGEPDADPNPDPNPDENPDTPPETGDYGAPCEGPEDCSSFICVPDGDNGSICSNFCIDECPDFFPDRDGFCRADTSEGGDVAFLCFPSQDLLCQPCVEDAQCDGALCITTDDGQVCGRVCAGNDDCPSGFSCNDVDGRGNACVPDNGSCSCNAETDGETRVCEQTNDFGTCRGEETCDAAQGWIGCNAPEAQDEICNGEDENCNGVPDDGVTSSDCTIDNDFGSCPGTSVCQGPEGFVCIGNEAEAEVCDTIDNNCDGEIDETFKDDQGRYGLFEHCGGCNVSCDGRFSFAAEVTCDADRETPTCVVRTCEDGYRLVGESLCVPLTDVACQACNTDEDCLALSPGAACLTLGDPDAPETIARVCGRDCSEDSLFGTGCDDGFACQTFREGDAAVNQCVPSGGTCFCQDNPDNFSVPCVVSDPNDPLLTCNGTRACVGDSFGDCTVPQDTCNGLDDDCDSIIDNGFRDPDTGKYSLDPLHCGRCNRDCRTLDFDNGLGVCDTGLDTPSCDMECLEGFVDLFNGTDDGCECQILDEDDTPNGADRNCDRIDGNVALGIFVSKIGSDDASGEFEEPVLTIQEAINRVQGSQGLKRDVYVSTGVYSENLRIFPGVQIYGGYSLDFLQRDIVNNQTTILGTPLGLGDRAAITAINITVPTVLDGFSIFGINAALPGESSYAVFIQDSDANFVLSNNDIFAGNGANGRRGDPGNNGTPGESGDPGSDAISSVDRNCSNTSLGGGGAGQLTCEGTSVSGGAGGSSACPITQRNGGQSPCNHTVNDCRNSCEGAPCSPLPPSQGPGGGGSGPGAGVGGSASFDRWTDGGQCGLCGLFPALDHRGNPGETGDSGNIGGAGQGCSDPTGSVDAEGNWIPGQSNTGGNGNHGGGGGGGAAGSGYDVTPGALGDANSCRDTIGGSGGGGGSGGCRGTGGNGGNGGGGSFGIMIHYSRTGFDSLPSLEDNSFARGNGGDGGNGGSGGVGGTGGLGAVGGIAVSSDAFCAEPGGRGGNGGNGGSGGGGGGGCGGIAVGVFLNTGGNNLNVASVRGDNVFVESGRAGNGGVGGGSTGNPGLPGTAGNVTDVLQQ